MSAPEEKTCTCICCPLGCIMTVGFNSDGGIVSVTGHTCNRGEQYARTELVNPRRTLTAIVRVPGILEPLSVKTSTDIPRDKIIDALEEISGIVMAAPVRCGDVVLKNVCGTGADIIATKNIG